MLAELRQFFASVGVLEVETPLACRTAGTDPQLQPMTTCYRGPGCGDDGTKLYLQTSPEFAMKRLLADGSGPIYQICKAFRDGESGRLHNPEFSVLEWYRPGFSLGELMDELVQVLRIGLGRPELGHCVLTYQQAFRECMDLDVLSAPVEVLCQAAGRSGIDGIEASQLDRDGWLDLLMSHVVQPRLGRDELCLVTDFPASQAALAKLRPDGMTAARVEVFYRGVELANGFEELGDANEQVARLSADNRRRDALGLDRMPVDDRLLGALRAGLPDCSGVAVGLDRVLMLRLGAQNLDDVLSFSFQRC
jgi:lysyl-tRNA synthetase class 2